MYTKYNYMYKSTILSTIEIFVIYTEYNYEYMSTIEIFVIYTLI